MKSLTLLQTLLILLTSYNLSAQWFGSTKTDGIIYRNGSMVIGGNTLLGSYGSNWKALELQDEGIISIGKSTNDRVQIVHSSRGSLISGSSLLTFSGKNGLRFHNVFLNFERC